MYDYREHGDTPPPRGSFAEEGGLGEQDWRAMVQRGEHTPSAEQDKMSSLRWARTEPNEHPGEFEMDGVGDGRESRLSKSDFFRADGKGGRRRELELDRGKDEADFGAFGYGDDLELDGLEFAHDVLPESGKSRNVREVAEEYDDEDEDDYVVVNDPRHKKGGSYRGLYLRSCS